MYYSTSILELDYRWRCISYRYHLPLFLPSHYVVLLTVHEGNHLQTIFSKREKIKTKISVPEQDSRSDIV